MRFLTSLMALLLVAICLYVLARETGVWHDIGVFLSATSENVGKLVSGQEFEKYLLITLGILGSICGLGLLISVNRRHPNP